MQETETLIGHVVREMLFSQFDKPGIPVGRTHLSTLVTRDYKGSAKAKKLPQVCDGAGQGQESSVPKASPASFGTT
jgi:hypothetical protein